MTNIPRSNPSANSKIFGNNRKSSFGMKNPNYTSNFNSEYSSNQTSFPPKSKTIHYSDTFFVYTGIFIKKVSEGILPDSAKSKIN